MQIYDPRRNEWREGPPLIKPRSRVGVVACGPCLWAVAGQDGEQLFSSMEMLAPETLSLDELRRLPLASRRLLVDDGDHEARWHLAVSLRRNSGGVAVAVIPISATRLSSNPGDEQLAETGDDNEPELNGPARAICAPDAYCT